MDVLAGTIAVPHYLGGGLAGEPSLAFVVGFWSHTSNPMRTGSPPTSTSRPRSVATSATS